MKKISQKEFFRRLINGKSAKLGAPIYPGAVEVSDNLARDLWSKATSKVFRSVIHTQSNALMFDNKSWFFYAKPDNCDSRQAYLHDIDGIEVLTLVDHRPAYKNQFGTPISEQTMVLAYEIQH
ncbi:MAG: hypothetical protein NC548_34765 [Lachnospiraceae bacterium]|nr:hypothetical protein [Lachnospiraceae bacterium]